MATHVSGMGSGNVNEHTDGGATVASYRAAGHSRPVFTGLPAFLRGARTLDSEMLATNSELFQTL